MSPIGSLIQDIHNQLSASSGDSSRASAPYFRYGNDTYDTNEGSPPQVRWRKLGGRLSLPQKGGGKATDDVTSSGSIATFQQDVECRVWGSTETEAINEFIALTQAMERSRTASSQGITQPSVVDNVEFQWLEVEGDRGVRGHALEFQYSLLINVPRTPVSMSTLLTASVAFTGSFGTGSFAEPLSGTLEPIFDRMLITSSA